MKKYIVLTIAILYCLFAKSQQVGTDIVNIDLPKEMKKLTKNEASHYVKKNFKTSRVPTDKGNVFVVDGLLLAFWDVRLAKDDKRSLQAIKAESLETLKLNKKLIVKNAIIKKINNNEFFILDYQDNDVSYYWFYSANRGGQALNGVIQYKTGDEVKVSEIAMKILKGMKFRK